MPARRHLIFYRPDALTDAQPTVSKHWSQFIPEARACLVVWSSASYPLQIYYCVTGFNFYTTF